MARSILALPVVASVLLFAACVDEEREPPTSTPGLAGPSAGAGVGMSTSSAGGMGGAGVGGSGGSTTSASGTGGAIQPGSDCDDSGDCGACISCSVLANCVDANTECNNDPTCIQALACYAGCEDNCFGDELCYADCEASCKGIQVGWPLADALVNCACNADCPKDCAAEQPVDCINQLLP